MEQQMVYVKDILSPVMNFLEDCGYDKHTLWGNMYNDFYSIIRFHRKLGFECRVWSNRVYEWKSYPYSIKASRYKH